MSLLFERNEYSWMRWRRGVLVSSFSPSSGILILSWYHRRHRGASGLRSVSVIKPDENGGHVVAAILAIPPTSFYHNECLEATQQTYFSTVFLQQVSNSSSQMVLSTSLSLQRNDFTSHGFNGFYYLYLFSIFDFTKFNASLFVTASQTWEKNILKIVIWK